MEGATLPRKLAFVDLETTGTNPNYDRIIEVGIVRVEDGRVVTRHQSLVDPGTHVSPFIHQYTGISAAMLADAPPFSAVADEISELLDDCLFVAHNVRFDFGFLRTEFDRQSLPFRPRQLCTVKLTRRLYPQLRRHNLDTIIEHFKLTCPRRHRALDDAAVLWDLYGQVLAQHGADAVAACIDGLTKKPTLPTAITGDMVQRLPKRPGIYIFRGTNNYPLYVGKSVNIHDRVLSHFSNDFQTHRHLQMCQQVEQIEAQETAGELGALLTESMLIKELQPLYNRVLRRKQEMVISRRHEHNGYLAVRLERVNQISPEEAPTILGVYPSFKRAKTMLEQLAKDHELCPKLLSLEAGRGRCFSAQLGACRGACTNDEAAVRYNLRFLSAFKEAMVRKWPFRGPIVFSEEGAGGRTEGFLIDKWCLLKRVSYQEEIADTTDLTYSFDFDTYKILTRFLLDTRYQAHIHQLTPPILTKMPAMV